MALNFKGAPYYDNDSKDFLKVLFKPGYAVQATELTQTQDILQRQLGNFGGYVFQNGSPVQGGQITLDTHVTYANLNPIFSNTTVNVSQFNNTIITDAATQTIRASVIATIPAIGSNPPTLMLKYLTGVNFTNGANITIQGSNTGIFASLANTNATGNGSCASIQEGVYYIDLNNLSPTPNTNAASVTTSTNAYFVNVPRQTIVLDAYDNTPTYMVGLQVSDAIVTAQSDSSLFDPALGSSNYQAPGADRYIINTTLSTRQLNSQDLTSFITLLTVANGQLQTITTNPQLSGIMTTLAKRTYDQSGSFTIKPFRLSLLDTANSDIANSNTQLYYAMVSPGNAYVDGYNYQTLAKQYLNAPRARTIANVAQYSIQNYFGNYVLVDTINGEFNHQVLPKLDIHCVSWANVVVTNAATYANTLIGTTNLRSFEYNSAANTANGLTYAFRAGLFNINTNPISVYTSSVPSSTTITFSSGASPVANAYAGMTINIPTTGDSRLITSYNGASLTATVNSPFSVTPAVNSLVSILSNIQDAESIGMNTMSQFVTANANINIGSKNLANVYQYTALADTSFKPLIFNFPNSTIAQGLQNSTYQYRIKIASGQSLTAGTPLVVNLSVPGDSSAVFASGNENGSDLLALADFLLVTNPGGGVAGTIIPMVASLSRSISTTSTTATFSIPSGGPSYTNVDIFASVKTSIGPKSKTLISANTTVVSTTGGSVVGPATVYTSTGQISFATPSTSNLVLPGAPQDLYISDGVSIAAIIDSGYLGTPVSSAMIQAAIAGQTLPSGAINITNNYTFYNGQKDSVYDHSSITLKPGAPLPVGSVLVLLNYFQPSSTGGYFSVDSYPNYTNIPIYQSSTHSVVYALRDCIDWRPVRDAATTLYTFNNSGTIFLPEPTATTGFTTSFGYYLARIDQLVLTSTGDFSIIQGSSSLNPAPAAIPKKSMLLYTMTLPPYTFYAANVGISQHNNQRYKMSDIGKLEKRIQTLEYYNALNQVEQAATNKTITDSNGVTVPQLGLLVDAFTGSSVAAVSASDYAASIDGANQQLRPPFSMASAGLQFDPNTSSNYKLNGVTITLPYTINNFISQNVTSRLVNLNPFNITAWNGNLTLAPSSDNWISTQTLPAVTTNLSGDNDSYQSGHPTSTVLGTVWNNWQTIYTGVSTTSSTALSNLVNRFTGMDNSISGPTADGYYGTTTGTSTTTTTTTTTQQQLQTGIQTVLSIDQMTVPAGTNLVSTSVIPYMREFQVNWLGRGLKPLTQVYPFFDNINVNNYVTPADVITFTGNVFFSGSISTTSQNIDILTDTDGGTNGGRGANAAQILLCKNNLVYASNVAGVIYPGKTFIDAISGNTGVVASYTHRGGGMPDPIGDLYKTGAYVIGSTPVATANTISLQASASSTTGYYVGNTISIVYPSTYAGQSATITAYDGPSRIATIAPSWNVPTLPYGTILQYAIGSLNTDSAGDIAGIFCIPDTPTLSFQTGTGTFTLTDASTGNPNFATTSATSQFVSQGTLDVEQPEFITTQVPVLSTQTVSQTQVLTNSQTTQTVATNVLVGYYDPLAQTFLVDNNQYPNGVFITSIRVCFQSIDSVLPVTLQIRPTENGYPNSSTIIPGSIVTLLPSQCKTTLSPSLDAAGQYTEFFFNDPIFLLPGNEFAIVLLSNSNNYNIYSAAVGDTQLGSSKIISQPPYLGVLFESQNASTWTPSQGSSLMFRINRAIFSTAPGFVTFKNIGFNANTPYTYSQPSSEFYMDTMYVTNNDQTSNNTSITYSFRGTANTTRSFDSSFTTFIPNKNYSFSNRYVVTPSYGSFDVQAQMQTPSQDISPIIDITRYSVIGIGNIINNGSIGNNQITITNPGNLYNIANTNSVTISSNNGSGAILTLNSLNSNGNVISIGVSSTAPGSLYSGSANITINAVGYTPSINATAIFNGETGTSGGNFLARYITRSVTLSSGVNAGNLQVWLNAYLPQGTTIFVYYKILNAQDNSTFASRPWVQMSVVGTQVPSITPNSFTQYQYVGGINQYGQPINSISYGGYNTFNQFAVKIVMATNNQSIVPIIKQLSCFALPASA